MGCSIECFGFIFQVVMKSDEWMLWKTPWRLVVFGNRIVRGGIQFTIF